MQYLSYQEAKAFSTPFFLLDENHLANQVDLIHKAFEKYWGNGLIAYSVKTNSLPYLAKVLHQQGVAAEVVSEDEYDFINKVTLFEGGNIVCNGPIKHESWIEKILAQKCYLNIDSKRELVLVEKYARQHPDEIIKVGLRVNNDIEDIFPNASTAGIKGSRFGFSYETGELGHAIEYLRSLNTVKIAGLHLHISTNLRSLAVYQYIVGKFDEIVKRYSLSDIEYLDAGGGFYGEVSGKPQWSDYISTISEGLLNRGYKPESLRLIIEPGVSLLSGCFSYYTRVEDVKDTARSHFVVLDGSRNHIDPLMHKTINSYFYSIEQQNITPIFNRPQILVGYTCLEYDSFFELTQERQLEVGDMIRFDKVGAYTLTFSPLFISWFPTVYSINNGKISIVRDRWTADEFLQKSKF